MLDGDATTIRWSCTATSQGRGSASDQLSRQCVQRDMEITRGFMHDRLLLRSLHEALDMLDDEGTRIKALLMADRLVELVGLRENPLLSAYATMKMQSIKAETKEAGDTEEDLELIAEIMKPERPPLTGSRPCWSRA